MPNESGEGLKPNQTTSRVIRAKGASQPMTRRGFLGLAATAVGSAVATVVEAKFGPSDKITTVNGSNPNSEPTPRSVAEVKETIPKYPEEFEAIFHHLTPDEEIEIHERILQSHEVLLEKTPLKEYMDDIYDYREIISAAEEAHDFPKNTLFGMFIAESQGRVNVASDAGALGPLQLMEEKAEELGVEDRTDVGEVFGKSAEAIKESYERYGDWGLAIWEWHMGSGNMWKLLHFYFEKEKGINFPEEGYRKIIDGDKLNVHRLLTSDSGQEFLKDGDWDHTDDYMYNVVTGFGIYRQYVKEQE